MHPLKYLLGCLCLAISVAQADEPWTPLFNGRNLDGWETYMGKPDPAWEVPGLPRGTNGAYLEAVGINRDPLHVFTIETNVVDGPVIHISGQGFGVMMTTETYTNFHLRLDIKWGEKRWGKKANLPRDTGLLYYCHGEPGAVDNTWPRSTEFQIQEHDFGDLFALGMAITVSAQRQPTNGPPRYVYDPKGEPTVFLQKRPVGNRCIKLEDAEKPRGEWNTLDLICVNGESMHIVNGRVVMCLTKPERLDEGAPMPLDAGKISLQTEGGEVYFRNVEIQAIDKIPDEYVRP